MDETVTAELGRTQASFVMEFPPDATLVQSPNNPRNVRFETDSHGNPTHHAVDDPRRSPSDFLGNDRVIPLQLLSATVGTATGKGIFAVLEGDSWGPAFAGKFALVSGHSPRSKSQILVTPAALERLGKHLGESVFIEGSQTSAFQIVGTLRDRTKPSNNQEIFTPAGAVSGSTDLASTTFYLPDTPVSWRMVQDMNKSGAVVLSREVLLNLSILGPTEVPADAPTLPVAQLGTIVPLAGFSLFEVMLLAGAAFMVGARRQQRNLAILASVGGDRATLFAVISFSGVVLGAIGGVIGASAGVGGAWAYMQLTSDGNITQYPGFHPNPLVLLSTVVFAIASGWVASALPARAASRTDVFSALRGALRPQAIKRRRPIIGLLLAAFGAVISLAGGVVAAVRLAGGLVDPPTLSAGLVLLVLGPVVMQIGAIMATPALLSAISWGASGIGLGAKLGARDVSRNAARTVPAVAAIMATIFFGSFVMTFAASTEAQARSRWDYWTSPGLAQADLRDWVTPDSASASATANALAVADAMKATFDAKRATILEASATFTGAPGSARDLFAMPRMNVIAACPHGIYSNPSLDTQGCGGRPYVMDQNIWVGSVNDIEVVIGRSLSTRAVSTLSHGGAISLYPQYLRSGQVTIDWRTGDQLASDAQEGAEGGMGRPSRPVHSATLPAVVEPIPHDLHFAVFMLDTTARSIGLKVAPGMVLVKSSGKPTDSEFDGLNKINQSLTGDQQLIQSHVEVGPPSEAGLQAWALVALCALLVLGAASVAIGLARSDGRHDVFTIVASGGTPRLRRSFNFWQAYCIAGTGAVIGTTLGTLPVLAIAVTSGGQSGLPFTPPLVQLGITAFGIPLVVALASAILTGSRTPARPIER
ncbi:FtsX-like permease family protein [Galbitalea soli]|uniref:ABC transporter permease n=1 Tax=Galbitalea soli TaxID=1268042 RepID=A0A7C9TQK7_9MICO|nr:ABC transporter permease [Galbitalea soli]NYJ30069.1 hypothetical protein [Galbitalea soli]